MTSLPTPKSATFYNLSAFYFFYFAAVGVYIIFMPELLKTKGYSSFEIGVVFSIAPIMRFLTPFLFLKYIPLIKEVFLVSIVAVVALSFAVVLSIENFYALCISFAFMGSFWSTLMPFAEIIALDTVKEKYGKARLYGSIGFIIIGLILGHIALTYGNISIAYIGTIALTAIFALLLSKEIKTTRKTHEKQDNSDFSILKHWQFWAMAFFMQMSFGGMYNFFTIYEVEHGVSLSTISWLWTFGVVAEIIMFIYQTKLLKNSSLLLLIKISVFATAIRWMLLHFYPDTLGVVFFTQAFHALSLALYHTASISYINKIYSNKALGQQFYLGIGYGLGAFAGSIVAGAVYGDYIFLWMSLFSFISFLFLYKLK